MRSNRRDWTLLAPALLLFSAVLVTPLLLLVRISLLPPGPSAPLEGPTSLASYVAVADGYYLRILWRTVRIAFLTATVCLLLGYPLAFSLVRSRGGWRSLQTMLILSPLLVSIVVRAYGWILLLGNRGAINSLLTWLGVLGQPMRLLHTEGAVVVGLVEALLPFMALSIAAVLEQLNPELEEAARGLGASALGAFCRITLPLSLPGALAGGLLVFMVSMGSYATPALLGGSQVRLMVMEIYTQVTAVFNWPFAAALSVVLLAVSLAIILVVARLLASLPALAPRSGLPRPNRPLRAARGA